MGTAQELYAKVFSVSRGARSPEYKAGVLAALRNRFDGKPVVSPYHPGTASYDAWSSGLEEGHSIWRNHITL